MLSDADIGILALTYALEVEKNGTRRLRPAPGKPSPEEQERETKKQERMAREKLEKVSLQDTADNATVSSTHSRQAFSKRETAPSESISSTQSQVGDGESTIGETSLPDEAYQADIKTQPSESAFGTSTAASVITEDNSDADEGEWITPSNVNVHKSRDLGLFPAIPAEGPGAYANFGSRKPKQKTVLKVACLTADYAMQNVALQMGLNVFGPGGKKIKDVKTWVLRCHACFKYVSPKSVSYSCANLACPTDCARIRPRSSVLRVEIPP